MVAAKLLRCLISPQLWVTRNVWALRKSEWGPYWARGRWRWGHLAVQAHFMPHGAKVLDSARSKNVLVGMAGASQPIALLLLPLALPGSPT